MSGSLLTGMQPNQGDCWEPMQAFWMCRRRFPAPQADTAFKMCFVWPQAIRSASYRPSAQRRLRLSGPRACARWPGAAPRRPAGGLRRPPRAAGCRNMHSRCPGAALPRALPAQSARPCRPAGPARRLRLRRDRLRPTGGGQRLRPVVPGGRPAQARTPQPSRTRPRPTSWPRGPSRRGSAPKSSATAPTSTPARSGCHEPTPRRGHNLERRSPALNSWFPLQGCRRARGLGLPANPVGRAFLRSSAGVGTTGEPLPTAPGPSAVQPRPMLAAVRLSAQQTGQASRRKNRALANAAIPPRGLQ